MTTIEAHSLAVAVEERIKQLVTLRRWSRRYRQMYPSIGFKDLEREYRIELRALVRIARQARKASSAIVDQQYADALFPEQADPVTAAKAYAELGYHDAQIAGPR